MAKRARKALGLTQAEFARLFEVSRSTVERWESDGVVGPALCLMAIIVDHPVSALKSIRRVMSDPTVPQVPVVQRGRPRADPPGAPAWPGAEATGARPQARTGETRVDAPADASFSGPPPPTARPPVSTGEDEVRKWGNQ